MVSIDVDFSGVSVPSDTSASVTIYEDENDDGGSDTDTVADGYTVSYDNKDTVGLSDGTTSYTTADTFTGGTGNSYQVYTSLDNTEVEATASETWNDLTLTIPDAVSTSTPAGDAVVGPGFSPINLPTGSVSFSDMATETAILFVGFIGAVGAAGIVLRNYISVALVALGVIALILSGTMNMGVEVFYGFIVAACLMIAAGMAVRWRTV